MSTKAQRQCQQITGMTLRAYLKNGHALGLTRTELAGKIGVSTKVITYWADHYGLKFQRGNAGIVRRFRGIDDTPRGHCDRYGVPVATVYGRVRRNGTPFFVALEQILSESGRLYQFRIAGMAAA